MSRSYQAVRYGGQRSQVAELWRPLDASGSVPVVAIFHGGFWRAIYTKRLMRGVARDVARRGWAAWNVEYRRVGLGGGWPATLEDAAAAMDHLRSIDGLDLSRVAVCGHSAGGQLALWSAARTRLPEGSPGAGAPGSPPLAVRMAVSLAGVVDLEEGAALNLGGGAVQAFLGGGPDERPERYAAASPAALRPASVEQVLVHGTADRVVPLAMSERYVERGKANGENVELMTLPGAGHRELIDPRGASWGGVARRLAHVLGSGRPAGGPAG